MDEKQVEKSNADYLKAKAGFLNARNEVDRQTHSEDKTWDYDHKTGNLRRAKGR